jgi:dTDP-4-amino-4,6-dideoxygalactose transaminase
MTSRMPTSNSPGEPGGVRFIEDKPVDWLRVQELLATSAEAGRWANFGPVEQRFASLVASMLSLPPGRNVVSASSATSALHALVSAHNAAAGRPLVWAVSAYGHVSTEIGPLAGRIRVVDCDPTGLIDIGGLSKLDPQCWDGVIATDLFGARPDFSALSDLCAANGKPLIIDAALSFPARRPESIIASEVISFHHTKPWGYGEGGCALVSASMSDPVRAFTNFGDGAAGALAANAGNGKMSDIAAAFIVQRLESLPSWEDGYRYQRQRITDLAISEGLSVLLALGHDAVVAHVPVLAPIAVTLDALPSAPFAVAKYYRPLDRNCDVAMNLYDRMVNVPCHPGMARIDDAALLRFFAALRG